MNSKDQLEHVHLKASDIRIGDPQPWDKMGEYDRVGSLKSSRKSVTEKHPIGPRSLSLTQTHLILHGVQLFLHGTTKSL